MRDRAGFFLSIGGYWDLDALITYVTTGFYREEPGGAWTYRPPKAYGKWVFVLSNAGRLADPQDASTLTEMANRKLDDKDAAIDDLVANLGPNGRAVYALVAEPRSGAGPELLGASRSSAMRSPGSILTSTIRPGCQSCSFSSTIGVTGSFRRNRRSAGCATAPGHARLA